MSWLYSLQQCRFKLIFIRSILVRFNLAYMLKLFAHFIWCITGNGSSASGAQLHAKKKFKLFLLVSAKPIIHSIRYKYVCAKQKLKKFNTKIIKFLYKIIQKKKKKIYGKPTYSHLRIHYAYDFKSIVMCVYKIQLNIHSLSWCDLIWHTNIHSHAIEMLNVDSRDQTWYIIRSMLINLE